MNYQHIPIIERRDRKCELLVKHKCELGECPVWDVARSALLWIDIISGKLYIYYTQTGICKTFNLPALTGSIVLTNKGEVLAATTEGFWLFNLENGSNKPIVFMGEELSCRRFNDGKCDPHGRFWAGTLALPGYQSTGNVYALETDDTVSLKIPGVKVSNGMCWDNDAYYFIDTPTQKVIKYTYDVATGNIKNPIVAINIPKEYGAPDGMTIDAEGMIWIALWNGSKIGRWDPITGNLLYTITLPVSKITSCTFGGANLNDLYITTANIGMSTTELHKEPLAGGLFVIKDIGYCGRPANLFKTDKHI